MKSKIESKSLKWAVEIGNNDYIREVVLICDSERDAKLAKKQWQKWHVKVVKAWKRYQKECQRMRKHPPSATDWWLNKSIERLHAWLKTNPSPFECQDVDQTDSNLACDIYSVPYRGKLASIICELNKGHVDNVFDSLDEIEKNLMPKKYKEDQEKKKERRQCYSGLRPL